MNKLQRNFNPGLIYADEETCPKTVLLNCENVEMES